MNYQDLKDTLDNAPSEVKDYIQRALDYYHNQQSVLINKAYLSVLEEQADWIESIQYLELLDDGDWEAVYEHAEGERE